jgi:hypothetical protein
VPAAEEDEHLATAARRLLAADRADGWTWCRGRSGVRLTAAALGVDTEITEAPTPPPAAPHHLCCGLVGHALAGTGHPAVVADLLDRLAADRTPRYLKPLPEGLHQPGLFQGAAGLALGLLALTRPGLPDPLRIAGGR